MQPSRPQTAPLPARTGRRAKTVLLGGIGTLVVGFVGLIGVAGCGDTAPPVVESKPYAGVAVTIACPDADLAADLKNRTAAWAAEHGATVTVHARPPADVPSADAAVVPAADLGTFAAAGKLAVLPARVRQADHGSGWIQVNEAYRKSLAGWAGEVVGLPVAADGFVLVYRADRLADPKHRAAFRADPKFGNRDLAPPATWDDVADLAGYFAAADGRPALPPLPADAGRLLTLFSQIAACHDRKALSPTDVTKAGRTGVDEQALGFHFDLATGTPRVAGPGFVAALDWLKRTKPARPAAASDDPVAAFERGDAVVGVLSLAELARLRDGGGKRFGIAQLPGSRTYFTPDGKPATAARNFVPYLGAGAKIGVVFKSSANADAAWDALADFVRLDRSLAMLSNAKRGYGPFRSEHTDDGRQSPWLGYDLDPERTADLAKALRQHTGAASGNPVFVLRTPDQAALSGALAKHVRAAATGDDLSANALGKAAAEWTDIGAKVPPATLLGWRRAAAGLQ